LAFVIFLEAANFSYFYGVGPLVVAPDNFALLNFNFKQQTQVQAYSTSEVETMRDKISIMRGDIAFQMGFYDATFILGASLGILFW
jgi:hypothetical protein